LIFDHLTESHIT